jgi:hypothetical protein
MRNFTAMLGGIAMLSILPATPAFAQSDNAAEITKEGVCGGFIPDEDGAAGDFVIGAIQTAVRTKSGVSTIVCKFDIAEGQRPASARTASGFTCGTLAGTTEDSKMTVSPSGNGTLMCRFKPST